MKERLNLLRVLSLIALMSSTLTAATLLPVTAQTDSLVGYWSFNEGTGPTAFDGSTFGNDGTLVGPTWTTGKVDGALQFNGGSPGDHVVIPYDSSLSLDTNRVTFAFWVYPTDLTHDYNTIIQKDTADNLWFDWVISPRAADVAYLPTCVIDLNADKVSQPTERASGDFILSANVWYFIACTFDGTDIKFYIDGTERGTTPTGGGSIPDSGTEIWIGATDVWPNEPFYGILDEFRIYNYALTQEEIQTLMNATAVTLSSFTASPTGDDILLEWKTATELDNLGFNVYRASAPQGTRTRLNASLIPTQAPGSAVGADYAFVDKAVEPGLAYYYWLEDVDVEGTATLHGPVSAGAPACRLLPLRPRLQPRAFSLNVQ